MTVAPFCENVLPPTPCYFRTTRPRTLFYPFASSLHIPTATRPTTMHNASATTTVILFALLLEIEPNHCHNNYSKYIHHPPESSIYFFCQLATGGKGIILSRFFLRRILSVCLRSTFGCFCHQSLPPPCLPRDGACKVSLLTLK